MKKIFLLLLLLLLIVFVAYEGLIFIDNYAQPWRMRETPAVRPHEAPLPVMPNDAIPIQGGDVIARKTDPLDQENPLPLDKTSLDRGKQKFALYCTMCHGSRGDGYGTVGQSFYPLPRDLRGPRVQEKSDGFLFYTVSFGQKRMPPLATTVSEENRWFIIHHIRSIAGAGVVK